MYKEYTYTVLLFVYKPHPIVSFQLIPKAAPRSKIVEISGLYFERSRYSCLTHNAVSRIRTNEKICHIVLLMYYYERILVLIVKQCSIRHCHLI